MHAVDNEIVDHIDRDHFNCQRANLRRVTATVNAYNRSKKISGRSKYFGVFKDRDDCFKVSITKEGERHYGGRYKNEDIAGWAYNQLAQEVYGEYALKNDIDITGYIWKDRHAVRENGMPDVRNLKRKLKHTSSKFFGVFRAKTAFKVEIAKDGHHHYGGRYKDEHVAAWAADRLLQELHGPNVRQNDIQLDGYKWENRRAVPTTGEPEAPCNKKQRT